MALLAVGLLVAACAAPPAPLTPTIAAAPVTITLIADGQTRTLPTTARTVGEALAQAGVQLAPADEVDPVPTTLLPLSTDRAAPLVVVVARVTESTEVIPEAIPFSRQIVRSAELAPDDPPRLLQPGRPGLREVTVRIVFRDGLEVERWPTASLTVEPAQDEIIMIGVGSESDRMAFLGTLAYIDDGRAILLDGATDAPRQLAIDGTLDGRVFQLSPSGDYLLYSIGDSDGGTFRNDLWIIATTPESVALSLGIENVLWAGWDPSAVPPRIAYTTARSTTLPPGWEANNDLWLLDLTLDESQPAPVRLVESYPAAYAWWGGTYSWTTGSQLAYAFADEVGVLTIPTSEQAALPTLPATALDRAILHSFTEFDTGGDWAWIPALAWSADGRFLAFTSHADDGSAPDDRFDLRLADVLAGNQIALVENSGIWTHAHWSPAAALPDANLVYLRAIEPEAGQDSSYALWLADSDGSDGQRLFPPEGESGAFALSQPLAWGPDPGRLAFIFDDALHILDLASGAVFRTGRDDSTASHPTWAPYGPGTN